MKKSLLFLTAAAIASTASAATLNLAESATYDYPASQNCSFADNNGPWGYKYMGFYLIGLKSAQTVVNRQCSDPVTLSYNGSQIAQLVATNPSDPIDVMAATAMDDDGLLEFKPTVDLMLIFDLEGVYGNGDASAVPEMYKKAGTYTLHIPEGLLKDNKTGELYSGLDVTYNVSSESVKVYKYSITPTPNSEVDNLATIEINFPEVTSMLSYVGDGNKCYLTLPNGEKVYNNMYPGTANKTLSLKFTKVTEWIPGTYTLTIPDKYIVINNPYFDEGDPGNVQAITASWTVVDKTIGVEGIAAEGETITVVDLDGRVILTGVAEDLKTLPNGLYIVNGKKCILK